MLKAFSLANKRTAHDALVYYILFDFTLLDSRQSSLDIYAFIKIYEKDLVGAFIKKVYDLSGGRFVFQISGPNKDHRFILLDLKKGVVFMDVDRPTEASSLAMMLRKQLSERKITGLSQPNFDRVLCFSLSSGQECILEMFRDGNLILTDGNQIEFALYPREWKNRKVIKGERYIPPASQNPIELDSKGIQEVVSKSKGSIVQTLATRLNFGGDLAEEVCFRSSISKDQKSITYEESSLILLNFKNCLKESEANFAYEYTEPVMISPIQMKHLHEKPTVFNDFNEGLKGFWSKQTGEKSIEESPIARRIKSMKRSIEEFEKRSARSRSIGMLMRQNLKDFDRVIEFVRSHNSSLQDLPLKFKEYTITALDLAQKRFTLLVGEEDFELDFMSTAGQNMDNYFLDSKTYREKIAGALRAIEESSKEGAKSSKPVSRQRPKEWYEVYRWFTSSEGFLVISGRDAKSNEKIVKKHLKDRDIYVHADVYGAPSTIIKVEGDNTPGEATIKEACTFAVCYSRAWSAGIRSGSAYWVLPSQVSKTPESGEFVSTGSWIVRGKRNYLFNLNLELEIGKENFKGFERPIVRPAEGGWANLDGFIRISSGKEKRLETVIQISKLLGLPRDEVESVLPPGGSMILDIRQASV